MSSALGRKRLLSILFGCALLISGVGVLVSVSSSNGTGHGTSPLSQFGISATGHQTITSPAPTGFTQVGNLAPSDVVTIAFFVPYNDPGKISSIAQAVSTPGSPSYHKFMTPGQIMTSFANSQRFNSLVSYLAGSGFTVLSTSMESSVLASGTVSQINQYLGLQMGVYSNGTASYYSAYGTTSLKGVNVYASNFNTLFLSHPPTLVNQTDIASFKQSVGRTGQVFPPAIAGEYLATSLQTVYNATGMYSDGYTGKGANIGILDFYGDPFIQNQLTYYDQLTGLPAPPSFTVVPIGPYQPALGVYNGWAGEISLDVESAHTMAPGANITLYAANGNLPLFIPISVIEGANAVQTLSQSFSIPEAAFANAPAAAVVDNVHITDFYYQLGAIEGISFMASTGDVGGSGFSGGPLGTAGYPSTSAFVTAVGGTTTYLDFNIAGAISSYNETAWSNYGMVPPEINFGGSTGGVSTLIPKPWYQDSIHSPAGFAVGGRMVPDVSLEAAVYPGMIFVFPGNELVISGGTSEASPLLAGLIALTDQYAGPQGLLNPGLYSLAGGSLYSRIFHPITYGYNIPWTAHYGYNLVTGLGSVDITALSMNLSAYSSSPVSYLNVSFATGNALPISSIPFPEYLNGSVILVNATITNPLGATVTTGSFNAYLVSLFGVEQQAALSYDAATGTWMGNLTLPVGVTGYGGLSDVVVNGSSAGVYGQSYNMVYVGYYSYFTMNSDVLPYALDPAVGGIAMAPELTLLNGTAVNGVDAQALLSSYGLLNNTYFGTHNNLFTFVNANDGTGLMNGSVSGIFPLGPSLLYMNDTGTFFPFFNGATTFNPNNPALILGSVLAEPGAVAPGQSVFVYVPEVAAPENFFSFNIMYGSLIDAFLVSPAGTTVSNVTTVPGMTGYLPVPAGSLPGLYTVIVNTSYDSYTAGTYINSTFYGQIYVAPAVSTMSVTFSRTTIVEGQQIQVNATIKNSLGQPIKYGTYSAVVYPANLQGDAYTVSEYENIPLFYDSTTLQWEGVIAMPSGSNAGALAGVIAGLPDYSGAYYMNIFGISSDGTPTSSSVTGGTAFNLQSPLVISIQASINAINSQVATMTLEINGLNVNATQMLAEIATLQAQLSALKAEAVYLNQTLGINTTSLQTQITQTQTQLTNLHNELSSTTNTAKNANNGISIAYALGIAGVLLGAVGLLLGAMALSRKTRPPGNQR